MQICFGAQPLGVGRGKTQSLTSLPMQRLNLSGADRLQFSGIGPEKTTRIDRLRHQMSKQNLDGYLVPTADAHLSEYVPDEFKRREWLTGFTGSAGTALVLQDQKPLLFVDSRYHAQVDQEVSPEQFNVARVKNYAAMQEKLYDVLRDAASQKAGFRLGFDPNTMSLEEYRQLSKKLEGSGVVFVSVARDLVDTVWGVDKPKAKNARVYALPEKVTGESTVSKLSRLRTEMAQRGTDVLPVTKLDQIAWLMNWRGDDIAYNPVFKSYAIVTPKALYLFTDPSRIDQAALTEAFAALGRELVVSSYEQYLPTLSMLSKNQTVLIPTNSTAYGTYHQVEQSGGQIREVQTHPIDEMKAVKNATEIQGMQVANLKASVAKTLALKWLEKQLAGGSTVTEETFRQELERLYDSPLSFNTISGAGPNSAIVHYGTPDPQKKLEDGEFYLVDSGMQYQSPQGVGTTDDTRSTVVGKADAEQTRIYTEVLKAHIDLARTIFPEDELDGSLDAIARNHLTKEGLPYGHGTGHGVGAMLNVHEGPFRLGPGSNGHLKPGNITSIEPGYYAYKKDQGGVRLENLYVVRDTGNLDGRGQKLLTFEPLTYIPFDKRLIDTSRMSQPQLTWLKNYHRQVVEKLSPHLKPDEIAWLKTVCQL